MAGYTKLFSEIVTSTIWQEDDKTRIIWITMLALSNKYGEVGASVPGLAHTAHVKLPECERALKKLESPDPYSRSQDFEGRRVKRIDGGFQILNYRKYREKMRSEERKEYLRIKQAEHRAKRKEQNLSLFTLRNIAHRKISEAVNSGKLTNPRGLDCSECGRSAKEYHHPGGYDEEHIFDVVPLCFSCHKKLNKSVDVNKANQSEPISRKQKAEAEAFKNIYAPDFERFWMIYPRKTGKGAAHKAWRKLKPSKGLQAKILTAIEQQKKSDQWQKDGGQFVPNPATWLNQGRWDDDLSHTETTGERIDRLGREGKL